MTWWWLSFADEESFRGACMLEATDLVHAARRAWELGINPGGEILGNPIPPNDPTGAPYTPPAQYCNRLLTKPECIQFDSEEHARYNLPAPKGGFTGKVPEELREVAEEVQEVLCPEENAPEWKP